MLDVHVIVVGDGIEPDEFGTVVVVKQLLAEVAADKSCRTRNKDRFTIEYYIFFQHVVK